MFWNVMLCSLVEVHFREEYYLNLQGWRVHICLVHSLTLKIEAVHSYKMSVNLNQTT